MKRKVFIFGIFALLIVGMMMSQASALVWHTTRTDITVTSGTTDLDWGPFWRNATANVSGATAFNRTLPCQLQYLDQTNTNFTITCSDVGAAFNLTVNGVLVNNTDILTAGTENVTTLAQMVTAGVTNTDNWLNVSFDCNSTNTVIGINITGADAALDSTWLAARLVITERDVVDPTIGTHAGSSHFTVNDSCNFTSNVWGALTDFRLNITYPSNNVTETRANWTIASVAANESLIRYVSYQKYGPYVFSVDDDSVGNSHEVEIRIYGREVLSRVVDWVIATSDSKYDDAFDNLNYNTLEITLNDVEVDDWVEGSIEMEDLTIRAGAPNNRFVFTWTTGVAGGAGGTAADRTTAGAAPTGDFLTDTTMGLPGYGWIIIIVIIAAVLVLAFVNPMKKKSKKKSSKK
jgi:hypothetical protein